jgi:hypothetical protein
MNAPLMRMPCIFTNAVGACPITGTHKTVMSLNCLLLTYHVFKLYDRLRSGRGLLDMLFLQMSDVSLLTSSLLYQWDPHVLKLCCV